MKRTACNRRTIQQILLACLLASLLVVTGGGLTAAKPFVWARSSDALTLDPHSLNEGTTHTLNHHIYEPLIIRNHTGKLEAALATSWTQSIDPLKWIFKLRTGVTFHDGQPFTANDVIFSIGRALLPKSDLRTRLEGVASFKVLALDEIEITTRVRDPLLPIRLTDIFIMSKAWATANHALKPQNFLAGEETYASTHTNGTGPYRLVSRDPGKETRLTRNENYWGWQDDDLKKRIAEIVYRPIPADKERITALIDGTVDFVQDVPLSELEVLRQAPALTLNTGPENRVIFLGLSVSPKYQDQPNPLANPAVRQALAISIDRRAIQRDIMLGQSIPTAVLAPPGINGFPFEYDEIPPRNLDKARALLKEAGLADGTGLALDCPNNRYVNDAAICQAIAKQLAEIGLKVSTQLRPKAQHFHIVRSGQSQFFLLGWGVPTFDSAYIFTNLFHTRTTKLGTWNGTGFSDPELDKRIEELSKLNGNGSRARSMSVIWQSGHNAGIYIPIHVQTLIYAMREGIQINVDISNTPKLKHATISPDADETQKQ